MGEARELDQLARRHALQLDAGHTNTPQQNQLEPMPIRLHQNQRQKAVAATQKATMGRRFLSGASPTQFAGASVSSRVSV